MTESAVVEIRPKAEKSEKKAKGPRPRFECVLPTHVVDVWRLVEASLRDPSQIYPDTTEDNPEVIRSHLFSYLQSPLFAGLMVRVGKRPVGVVLGNVSMRPFGRPSRFVFVQHLWVEPQFRKRGIGTALWSEYVERLKQSQVFHFEAIVQPEFQYKSKQCSVIQSVIGGRL